MTSSDATGAWMAAMRLPEPLAEFRFAPPRRWRLDFAWPEYKLALEVEGGVWTRGRHVRGKGFVRDMEKYNTLCVMGWRLLRVAPADLHTQATADMIRKSLSP